MSFAADPADEPWPTVRPCPMPPASGTPWAEARVAAHSAPEALTAVLRERLTNAAGMTLAEPIVTSHAMPPFDTAAMDGFAVAGQGPWRVVGKVRAGTGR